MAASRTLCFGQRLHPLPAQVRRHWPRQAPGARHEDRPLRPFYPLRRQFYLERDGSELAQADRGRPLALRFVQWVLVVGMCVDDVMGYFIG